MSALNGDDLIQQISHITLLYTDKELIKHFGLDAPKVFRKCADRIEGVFKRKEKCQNTQKAQSKN